jgi:membrane-associated protein
MSGLQDYIIAFGYLGVFITIFAESGFLLGFFLPGDSLLFTVGLLASQGYLNIWVLLVGCIVMAILGDSFGYYMGAKLGPRIFSREDSWLFKKKYLIETEEFYKKYGKKTIILARFVPIVRTFAPIFAGIGNMNYRTFLAYNIVGGFIWAGGFLSVAYVLGKKIPGIEHYLEYIIIGIVLVSVLPVAFQFLKRYRRKQ